MIKSLICFAIPKKSSIFVPIIINKVYKWNIRKLK